MQLPFGYAFNNAYAYSGQLPNGFLNAQLTVDSLLVGVAVTTSALEFPRRNAEFFSVGTGSISNFNVAASRSQMSVQNVRLTAESCLPANGAIDPGEVVTAVATLVNDGDAATTISESSFTTTNLGIGIATPIVDSPAVELSPNESVDVSLTYSNSIPCGESSFINLVQTATPSLQTAIHIPVQIGVASSSFVNVPLNTRSNAFSNAATYEYNAGSGGGISPSVPDYVTLDLAFNGQCFGGNCTTSVGPINLNETQIEINAGGRWVLVHDAGGPISLVSLSDVVVTDDPNLPLLRDAVPVNGFITGRYRSLEPLSRFSNANFTNPNNRFRVVFTRTGFGPFAENAQNIALRLRPAVCCDVTAPPPTPPAFAIPGIYEPGASVPTAPDDLSLTVTRAKLRLSPRTQVLSADVRAQVGNAGGARPVPGGLNVAAYAGPVPNALLSSPAEGLTTAAARLRARGPGGTGTLSDLMLRVPRKQKPGRPVITRLRAATQGATALPTPGPNEVMALWLIVDPTNQLPESNEANNVVATPLPGQP